MKLFLSYFLNLWETVRWCCKRESKSSRFGVSVQMFPVIGSIWPFAPAQIQSKSIQFAFQNVSHLLFCTEIMGLCCTCSTNINQNFVCFCILHIISMLFLLSYIQKYDCKWVYVNVCIISPHLLMKTTNKLSLAGKKINAFSHYIMMVYGNQGTF